MSESLAAPHHFAYSSNVSRRSRRLFVSAKSRPCGNWDSSSRSILIRKPSGEPAQDCFRGGCGITFLPEKHDEILASNALSAERRASALD